MKKSIPTVLLLAAALLLSCNQIFADVRLPKILGSNMVLQRNQELKIWGWADKGEKVTVHFNEVVQSTRADREGRWLVTLPAMKAGGPYSMKIRGRNIIELENILIGDVWICSGQSNMEFPVQSSNNAEEEASHADYHGLRLFTVPNNVQFEPADDIPDGEWLECNPETVLPFSAVGYFFGRDIHRELKVPVGLISTNWGGTVIETWISMEAISTVPDFEQQVKVLRDFDVEKAVAQKRAELQAIIEKYAADQPGIQDGRAIWADPELKMEGWGKMDLPGLWEGRGLDGLDGIVWFRHEFYLPAEVAARGITLELGRIDDSDQTWVNGNKTGETVQKYNQDRFYPVPPEYLKEGRNVIAVRVEDTGGGGGFHGDPLNMKVVSEDFVIPLAGECDFRVSPAELKLDYQNLIGPNQYPTLLYNGMIHPLLNFPIMGAIWYQGESNAGRAYQYRRLLPLMIEDWRKHWNEPDFPFFIVQLANFMAPPEEPGESAWAELREAQSMTLSLPKTGMAVIIDIGEADNIHPRNKQDVGKRLALSALKVAYGMDVVSSGPVFREMRIEGPEAILSFDQVGSGLVCRDRYGYLKGFAVAGADRVFHWAKAYIEGDRVRVSCDEVKVPVAARYGWADNPDDVNLYNMEGLPASPFRTDDWPGITIQK
jgi:sialate O-acetylesterase